LDLGIERYKKEISREELEEVFQQKKKSSNKK